MYLKQKKAGSNPFFFVKFPGQHHLSMSGGPYFTLTAQPKVG